MGVEKFLGASTGYITYEDSLKLLDAPEAFPSRVLPHEYGWWISTASIDSYRLEQMKQDGYSEAFICLVKMAAGNDCWWINLDADGEDVEGLEQIEW
jgi:hypothetical protein